MSPRPRLVRTDDRWIGGVCAGLAHFLGWQPIAIRALFVMLTVFSYGVPGVPIYLLLWWIIPPGRRGFDLDDFRSQ